MATGGTITFNFEGNTKDLDAKTSELKDKMGGIASSIGSAFVKGSAIAGGALVGMVGASVKAFADIEQSVGGVETLFKDNADAVIENANRAYKTAGLSANAYMETVTSFSASLLQSLSGDTKKASEYADRAIVDMSDNANKMGTSMEMIQNAYQGFAKQNYTMLDNLKLGYGGTKEEMARLIADASKMTDIQKELNLTVDEGDMSFGNIVNAISIMQSSLGIAGTTAKEATETISGSLSSTKSAFDNFLTGTGSIDDVVNTFTIAGNNIMKAIVELAPKIVDGVVQMVNQFIPMLPTLIETLLPVIINGVTSLINGVIQALPTIIPILINGFMSVIDAITNNLPMILEAGINIIMQLIQGLISAIPKIAEKIPTIIETIINTLTEPNMLMQLIMSALDLIVALTNGLMDALPTLIEAIPTIILNIVTALTQPEMINKLGETGLKLVESLTFGLLKSIPYLLKGLGQLGVAIAEAFAGFLVGIPTVGLNMVKGLWEGIKDATSWLLNKIAGFGNSILKGIKGVLGIHSPSTEFAWVGKMSGEGYVEGLDDMSNDIQDQLNTSFGLNPNVVANAGMNFSPVVNTTVVVNNETDPLGQLVNNVKTFSNGAKNDYNYGM